MGLNIDMPIPRDGGAGEDFGEINGLLGAIAVKSLPSFPSDESLAFDEWPDPFAEPERSASRLTAAWVLAAAVISFAVAMAWQWAASR